MALQQFDHFAFIRICFYKNGAGKFTHIFNYCVLGFHELVITVFDVFLAFIAS